MTGPVPDNGVDEGQQNFSIVRGADVLGFTPHVLGAHRVCVRDHGRVHLRSWNGSGSGCVAEEISEDFQHLHCPSENISRAKWCIRSKRPQ